MALSPKIVRKQLELFRPIINGCSLETARKGQEILGTLMFAGDKKVSLSRHDLSDFEGIWVYPNEETRNGVILYLHGGGFVSGDIEYCKGFSSLLAARFNVRVFAAAYRLAPEAPFPAALDDALNAYKYLLSCGYSSSRIVLCGESAGGGLIYSLAARLRELSLPMCGGFIAISPWTDMTASGESYARNASADPSMTKERLRFFSEAYTHDPSDPLVSPLFGELTDLPPSLIFAGEDEIMLSDSVLLHQKLTDSGCESELTVAPGMWHAYLLYNFKERKNDYLKIDGFLDRVMPLKNKLHWMRLDNAAKIYPAARRRNWSNVFRLSMTLSEPVDPVTLQSALDVTARRFPSISVRIRRGMFWYYLEEIRFAPKVLPDNSYPLTRMPFDDIRKCAFRVLYYKNRISVEFFHALTDGNGGLIFLKSLVAEYLEQRYGAAIPYTNGVFDRLEPPKDSELEDSFLKYAGGKRMSRREDVAFHLEGTPETDGYKNIVTGILDTDAVLSLSRAHGVTLTVFLTAVMMRAICNIQQRRIPKVSRRKAVKVLIPVNLRKLYPSESLRNFVLYVTPGIDPSLGEYTFEEILKTVQSQMNYELTAKRMRMRITKNVHSEQIFILKIMPLFIKNIAMKAVFNAIGERASCLTMSNLGAVTLPEEMQRYVQRMDFILGVQAVAPNNCGVVSYGGKLYINFIRDTKEPELEREFFTTLRALGLNILVESNSRPYLK
ncbi:MAG: alpha/beta hydrolase fold domain-containing protein [Clostridia bacterium]|nr:alpha/beta hydrolase fold domain-containing protein [Clostridia bacterium]